MIYSLYTLIVFATTPFFPPDLPIKKNPIHINTFYWKRED